MNTKQRKRCLNALNRRKADLEKWLKADNKEKN